MGSGPATPSRRELTSPGMKGRNHGPSAHLGLELHPHVVTSTPAGVAVRLIARGRSRQRLRGDHPRAASARLPQLPTLVIKAASAVARRYAACPDSLARTPARAARAAASCPHDDAEQTKIKVFTARGTSSGTTSSHWLPPGIFRRAFHLSVCTPIAIGLEPDVIVRGAHRSLSPIRSKSWTRFMPAPGSEGVWGVTVPDSFTAHGRFRDRLYVEASCAAQRPGPETGKA